MYILRPLRMTLCTEKWFQEDAVTILQCTDPTTVPDWVAGSYDTDDVVADKGYDFISLMDGNTTRPSGNFLGRSPKSDDTYTGSGSISWIRKGYSNKYRSFSPDAAGYTESDGAFEVILNPANACLYPESTILPSEKMFLLCGGVIGSSLNVSPLNFGGGEIIIDGVTQSLTSVSEEEIDYVLNPELPSSARSYLFPTTYGLDAEDDWNITDAFRILVSPRSEDFYTFDVSYVENLLVGRITQIGKLQWSNHNYVTEDKSKIVTDNWGLMSLSKRRVAKKIDCEIVVEPRSGETIVDAIGNTLKFFAFLRGSVNVFIFNNKDILNADLNAFMEIPYGDAVTGIIRSCTISDFSAEKAVVKVTIASIPTGYKV